jgi:hypothetical protein
MWTPVGALLADETMPGARLLELFRLRSREVAAERAAAELAAAPRPEALASIVVHLRRPDARAAGFGFDAWLRINGVDAGDVDQDAGVLVDVSAGTIEYESLAGRRQRKRMRLTPPVSLLEQPPAPGGVR